MSKPAPKPAGKPGAVQSARRTGPNRTFLIALAAIAVAGIAAITYASRKTPQISLDQVDRSMAAQAEGYLLGDPNAPVQIFEFADFECPACAQFATVTEPDVRKRLIETGQASYRFFDLPLNIHKNTWPASNAAACANEQGKFWEYHDRLFEQQDQWSGLATASPKGKFEGYARDLGLDVGRWEACYDEQRHLPKIKANAAEAMRRNVGSTPTFIVGGTVLAGAVGFDQLRKVVDSVRAAGGGRIAMPGDSAVRPTDAPAGVPVPATATPAGTATKQ